MPTYKEIIASISPESALVLRDFIAEGIIKEHQIVPIIEKSLASSDDLPGPHTTQKNINKLIY
jgi:hypothetical protein